VLKNFRLLLPSFKALEVKFDIQIAEKII